MNKEQKNLAEELKAKLNSPDYVAVSEILGHDDRYGDMIAFLIGAKADGNIHKEENWINGTNINPGKGNKHKSENMVCYSELEPANWEEIVNLIETRNKEKEEKFNKKRNEILARLNNQNNLYYYWSDSHGRDKKNKANCWVEYKGMRGYTTFMAKENGREYGLYIAENHPILDKFPFEKGFYVIDTDKPIERVPDEYWSDGGEENPNNFHKWVEVGDEITITPENGEKIISKIDAERKISNNDVDKNLMAGEAAGENLNLTAGKAELKNGENNNSTAVTESSPSSTTENKQLAQILRAIQSLEQRIIELEKTGDSPQQVQALKQEVKVLETQRKSQFQSANDKKSPRIRQFSQSNKSTKIQTADNSSNSGSALLIFGGLLVISAALVIGYLLGKDKKANK